MALVSALLPRPRQVPCWGCPGRRDASVSVSGQGQAQQQSHPRMLSIPCNMSQSHRDVLQMQKERARLRKIT